MVPLLSIRASRCRMTRIARRIALFAWSALVLAATPSHAYTVIEYYNAALDHYFITPLADEIVKLDTGVVAGWTRTGYFFDGYATSTEALGTTVSPVCRFYIPPQHGDSHFLSASPAECAVVRSKVTTDPNFSGYIEETPAEFYIALPDTTTGVCPGGTQTRIIATRPTARSATQWSLAVTRPKATARSASRCARRARVWAIRRCA